MPKDRPNSGSPIPASIDETLALLGRAAYVAERSLATVLFLRDRKSTRLNSSHSS